MASSMKLFFLLLLSFSFSRTQAREGRFFFNKTTRPADPTELATPTAEKIDGPTTLPPQSQNGYGLYGRGPEHFSPTTTTTTATATHFDDARRNNGNNLPSNLPNTELANERYDETNNNMERNNYRDRYNNANEGFDTERRQRYGMSDTRFLDNGRYYYDVNAERYGDGNDKWNARRGNNQKEYGVYDNQVGNKRGKYGGDEAYNGYGNRKEYDNGVMEYQNNQENQEEYVP